MHRPERFYHNSADCFCRSPLGAVPTGQPVTITLHTPTHGEHRVLLRLFAHGRQRQIEMAGDMPGSVCCTLEPAESSGVLWYDFFIQSGGEEFYYGLPAGETAGEGEISYSVPAGFQLTVYEAGFDTPQWMREGVIYQIFPDRFQSGDRYAFEKGVAYHRSMGRQVVLHEDWGEMPLYQPLPGKRDYDPCDFFGGDLAGIEAKLEYLAAMGITIIYLNPVVEAASNHRYDTADYRNVDPMLGGNKAFESLCRAAKKRGIRVICDGVFSHTGSDSIYFNKPGTYPGLGAYQGPASPYYSWYRFEGGRDQYKSWWGFKTLPEVDEHDPAWREFVISGKDSVLHHWLKLGASGFRLDVADELPDETIAEMRRVVKESGDNLLLGEVWEDPTTKESYGYKRRYALGAGLDSVMNYPWRTAVIDFLLYKCDAAAFCRTLVTQQTNYPPAMYYALQNLLSSHDVARIRTVLSTGKTGDDMNRDEQAQAVENITLGQVRHARQLQKLATVLQFMLPGTPCIYYGDEQGMQGFRDPFNRGAFVEEDGGFCTFTREIAAVRQGQDAVKKGDSAVFTPGEDVAAILRFCHGESGRFGQRAKDGAVLAAVNRSGERKAMTVHLEDVVEGLPAHSRSWLNHQMFAQAVPLIAGAEIEVRGRELTLYMPPYSYGVWELQ